MILSWGSVDPQMARYNFTSDVATIFPNEYIQSAKSDIVAADTGILTSGCFFKDNTDNLTQVNSSWAVGAKLPNFKYPTSTSSNIIPLLNLTQNMTDCGISPILNVTLLNATAQDNFLPYQSYA